MIKCELRVDGKPTCTLVNRHAGDPQCKECLDVETPNIEVFKPMWYDDIAEKPIYIESKRKLKEECKKRNLVAVRLL